MSVELQKSSLGSFVGALTIHYAGMIAFTHFFSPIFAVFLDCIGWGQSSYQFNPFVRHTHSHMVRQQLSASWMDSVLHTSFP